VISWQSWRMGVDEQWLLDGLHPGAQGVFIVIGLDGHGLLRDHRAGCRRPHRPVDGDARCLCTGRERVAQCMCAGERRQQRRCVLTILNRDTTWASRCA